MAKVFLERWLIGPGLRQGVHTGGREPGGPAHAGGVVQQLVKGEIEIVEGFEVLVLRLLVTPKQFADAVIMERLYAERNRDRLRSMINSVIYRDDVEPDEFIAALAEKERALIAARTKSALAAAKARGTRRCSCGPAVPVEVFGLNGTPVAGVIGAKVGLRARAHGCLYTAGHP